MSLLPRLQSAEVYENEKMTSSLPCQAWAAPIHSKEKQTRTRLLRWLWWILNHRQKSPHPICATFLPHSGAEHCPFYSCAPLSSCSPSGTLHTRSSHYSSCCAGESLNSLHTFPRNQGPLPIKSSGVSPWRKRTQCCRRSNWRCTIQTAGRGEARLNSHAPVQIHSYSASQRRTELLNISTDDIQHIVSAKGISDC